LRNKNRVRTSSLSAGNNGRRAELRQLRLQDGLLALGVALGLGVRARVLGEHGIVPANQEIPRFPILERGVLVAIPEAAANASGLGVDSLKERATILAGGARVRPAIPILRLSEDGVKMDFVSMLAIGVTDDTLADSGLKETGVLAANDAVVLDSARLRVRVAELALVSDALSGLAQVDVPLEQREAEETTRAVVLANNASNLSDGKRTD